MFAAYFGLAVVVLVILLLVWGMSGRPAEGKPRNDPPRRGDQYSLSTGNAGYDQQGARAKEKEAEHAAYLSGRGWQPTEPRQPVSKAKPVEQAAPVVLYVDPTPERWGRYMQEVHGMDVNAKVDNHQEPLPPAAFYGG